MRRAFVVAMLLVACDPGPSGAALPRELAPEPNPFGPSDPLYAPQPHRDRPRAIVRAGDRLVVALGGTETSPGREVAVLDARTLETLGRVEVGPAPFALAAHPSGRYVAVTCRYASYLPVVDVERLRVVGEAPVPFYTEGIAFSPDGRAALATNRWKDSLLRFRVTAGEDELVLDPLDRLAEPTGPVGIPTDENPLRVRYLPGGDRALVTSETSLSVTLVDATTGRALARHHAGGPVTDAAVLGDHVFVLHTGAGTGHPPDDGFDGDGDGAPGDGTANVTFQDVQNEIDVLSASDLSLLHRYTSDTICCFDYRDVDPDDPSAGTELREVDRWPPERVAFLPPPRDVDRRRRDAGARRPVRAARRRPRARRRLRRLERGADLRRRSDLRRAHPPGDGRDRPLPPPASARSTRSSTRTRGASSC